MSCVALYSFVLLTFNYGIRNLLYEWYPIINELVMYYILLLCSWKSTIVEKAKFSLRNWQFFREQCFIQFLSTYLTFTPFHS